MVFYRKYRPQTLDDLVGQTAVKQTLKSAITTGKLAHAYLFTGPKGTGKTSTARVLAKVVNCEHFEEGLKDLSKVPCNKCTFCTSITDGSNLDVVEMDAASNRGIDDIRALRENIKLAPTSARKKVYIIDEVHMLSGDAFNALLKTLEEPPAHVMFVLATTEVHKVPQTILSRVQRLDFKAASSEEMVESLRKITESEKIKIDQDALAVLAKRAGGSFRDGHKLLDQLSSLETIDQSAVNQFLGSGAFEGMAGILDAIAEGDSHSALTKLLQQTETGANIKELNLSFLDLLRQMLFIKNDLGALVKKESGDENFQVLSELAAKFDIDKIIFTIDSFQKSLEQSRYVSIPTLPLEVAVVESCRGEVVKVAKIPVQRAEEQVAPQVEVVLKSEKKETQPESKESERPVTQNDTQDTETIKDRWSYILDTVKQNNYSLEALLRSSKLLHCHDSVAVIEVPYSFHQRILEAPKSRNMVEAIFSDVVGKKVVIEVVLGKKSAKLEEMSNVEVAADDEIVRAAAEIFGLEPVG